MLNGSSRRAIACFRVFGNFGSSQFGLNLGYENGLFRVTFGLGGF